MAREFDPFSPMTFTSQKGFDVDLYAGPSDDSGYSKVVVSSESKFTLQLDKQKCLWVGSAGSVGCIPLPDDVFNALVLTLPSDRGVLKSQSWAMGNDELPEELIEAIRVRMNSGLEPDASL